MSKKILISNSLRDGKKLANRLGYSFYQETTIEKYPDTEKVIGTRKKISEPADVIHWQFNNAENFDDQIINLLAFVNKFSDTRITRLVLPYTPYGRATALADYEVDKLCFLLKTLSEGVKKLYLVVVHHNFEQSKRARVGLKNIFVIDVDDQLVTFLDKKFGDHFILISPDEGFSETVSRLAKRMGMNYVSLTKHRLSPVKVIVMGTSAAKRTILKNKDSRFVIIDDIVSTGETFKQSTIFLRSLGIRAKNISFIAVHDTRRKKINEKVKVFCSNSLSTAHPAFDITESIVKALQSR